MQLENCECGENDHQSPRYPLCKLNPNNIIRNKTSKSCKCGSTTHRRTSYHNCPLNKRFVRNSQANQTNTLDDYIEITNNQILDNPEVPIVNDEYDEENDNHIHNDNNENDNTIDNANQFFINNQNNFNTNETHVFQMYFILFN